MTSFSNYLSRKTSSQKHVPTRVLTYEENVAIVAWILVMQKCGLLVILQQLKLKVVELTKT